MPRPGITLEDNIQEVARQYPLLFADTDGDKALLEQQGIKQLYLNPAQRLAHNMGSRVLAVCGGRGLGKTTFEALRLQGCVSTLPRATGALFGA